MFADEKVDTGLLSNQNDVGMLIMSHKKNKNKIKYNKNVMSHFSGTEKWDMEQFLQILRLKFKVLIKFHLVQLELLGSPS